MPSLLAVEFAGFGHGPLLACSLTIFFDFVVNTVTDTEFEITRANIGRVKS